MHSGDDLNLSILQINLEILFTFYWWRNTIYSFGEKQIKHVVYSYLFEFLSSMKFVQINFCFSCFFPLSSRLLTAIMRILVYLHINIIPVSDVSAANIVATDMAKAASIKDILVRTFLMCLHGYPSTLWVDCFLFKNQYIFSYFVDSFVINLKDIFISFEIHVNM